MAVSSPIAKLRQRFSGLQERLEPLCKELGVEKLWAYGSALRDDFHVGSDVDLLARFSTDAPLTFARLFAIEDRLSREVFAGFPVEIHLEDSLTAAFRRHVGPHMQLIYEQEPRSALDA